MSFFVFAQSCGLLTRSFIADGRIHRCGTTRHVNSKNGAYMFDGTRGWCMTWESGESVQWWNDSSAKPWTDSDKKQWADRRKQEEKQRIEGYSKAALKASQMLSECVIDTHAYLRSKQLPETQGMVFADGSLLIPMRDCKTNQITGLQSIKLDNDQFIKKFLTGMRAKGSVYKLGSGKKIILVEGYATGISVYSAARRMNFDVSVMCCFSANNLVHVAKSHGHYVMADSDASKVGEQAAIETGLPWMMPSEVNADWNDVYASHGLMQVCMALKDLFRKVA